MVVFGGDGTSDVWSLDMGNPAWKKLSPTGPSPGPYSGHTAIYDEVGGRMVVTSGGFHVPILTWASPVSAPIEAGGTTRVELASPRPNPARDETSVDFRLPMPAHVTLDVFDAQGRHVKRLAESWFPAGPHTRTWLGDDESGRAVRTGVYFVCMRAGESVSTRRTMRIH
jgi:hypothetical protein